MTDSVQSEERYPLLFLFLDDGNKASRKNKGVFFERGRSQGIMSGATAVLTQWPGHLSSCGLMMIVLTMAIFFFFLMLLASSIKPTTNTMHPRCLRRSYDDLDTNLFLVHDDSFWEQNELDVLENILTKYIECDVELLILREDNSTRRNTREFAKYVLKTHKWNKRSKQSRRHAQLKNVSEEKLDLNINIGAKNLLKAFLERRRHLNITTTTLAKSTTTTAPHLPSVNDILLKFPKLLVKNMTKSAFFENSPLYGSWKTFNKQTLNFAARVLRLWENGGISFEIPQMENDKNQTDYYKYDIHPDNSTTMTLSTTKASKRVKKVITPTNESKLLKNMIDIGYISFHNLPEGLVTVDEEGLHMETKTTCHAFFGEALVQLKQATNETTVPEVIKNTLKTFCVRGAVDSEYCSSIRSK